MGYRNPIASNIAESLDSELPPIGATVAEKIRAPRPGKRTQTNPLKDAILVRALARGLSVSAAMEAAGYDRNQWRIRKRITDPDGDIRMELSSAMDRAGLTLPRALQKISEKLDATKTLTIAGDAHTQDDNDAQLRAVEQHVKLLERAGMIPSAASESGSSSITVNVLVVK